MISRDSHLNLKVGVLTAVWLVSVSTIKEPSPDFLSVSRWDVQVQVRIVIVYFSEELESIGSGNESRSAGLQGSKLQGLVEVRPQMVIYVVCAREVLMYNRISSFASSSKAK